LIVGSPQKDLCPLNAEPEHVLIGRESRLVSKSSGEIRGAEIDATAEIFERNGFVDILFHQIDDPVELKPRQPSTGFPQFDARAEQLDQQAG
jgi:hypothetical protein